LDADVVLLDISSEFCVNTYLAFSLGDNRPIGLFGCGTSLSAPHAAERALTELVQLRLSATRADTARHLELQWRHLASFPRLQRCLRLDIDDLMSKSRQQCVTLPADCEHRTLDEQIRVIAHNVRSHNRELGISILYQTDSGTTLANVVIPGLERFYIVSTGNVVIPQARGQALNECYG
jgi:ribosomal protein S12 methylthiotransferase accessory factor